MTPPLPPLKEKGEDGGSEAGRDFEREEELPGQESERGCIHLKSLLTLWKLKPFKGFSPSMQPPPPPPPPPLASHYIPLQRKRQNASFPFCSPDGTNRIARPGNFCMSGNSLHSFLLGEEPTGTGLLSQRSEVRGQTQTDRPEETKVRLSLLRIHREAGSGNPGATLADRRLTSDLLLPHRCTFSAGFCRIGLSL